MIPTTSGGMPLVMGVVNVTPDSFSDGGQWFEPDAAIAHGRDLLAEGADILDVGGESTRPGAERPPRRGAAPGAAGRRGAGHGRSGGVRGHHARRGRREALAAGARVINDVSGGLADPEMAAVAAGAGVPFVAMHWRGHSRDMQDRAVYTDVAAEVCAELSVRAEELQSQGISRDNLVLDPGFGFSKLAAHNWSLLRHLDQVTGLGFPVLVGTSRKAFLGRLGVPEGSDPVHRSSAMPRPPPPRCMPRWPGCGRCGSTTSPPHWTPCGCPRRSRGVLMDQIVLTGIAATGYHGVLDFERDGQQFVVDVVMDVDLAPAGASDELGDTVNYAEVAGDVVALIEGEPLDLIEALAERIATAILTRPLVEAVEVVVHKPQAPVGHPFTDVQVRVRRERETPVVIALGSNLGESAEMLHDAAVALFGLIDIDAVSPSSRRTRSGDRTSRHTSTRW